MPKASFSVVFAAGVDADLRTVPFPFRRQINQRIFKLKETPRPSDSEVLEGEVLLLKVDRWGLVYEVDYAAMAITVWGVIQL